MLTWNVASVVSSCALLLAVACGGSSSTSSDPNEPADPTGTGAGSAAEETPAPPASSPPPATTSPPAPPGSCNVITNDAASAVVEMVAAAAPAPTGGPLVNGTYHLTAITAYTGKAGSSGPLPLAIKQTIAVSGTTVDVAEETDGKVTHLTEVFTVNGSSIALSRTCPSPMKGSPGSYSASGNTFVLFLLNDVNQTVSYTYER